MCRLCPGCCVLLYRVSPNCLLLVLLSAADPPDAWEIDDAIWAYLQAVRRPSLRPPLHLYCNDVSFSGAAAICNWCIRLINVVYKFSWYLAKSSQINHAQTLISKAALWLPPPGESGWRAVLLGSRLLVPNFPPIVFSGKSLSEFLSRQDWNLFFGQNWAELPSNRLFFSYSGPSNMNSVTRWRGNDTIEKRIPGKPVHYRKLPVLLQESLRLNLSGSKDRDVGAHRRYELSKPAGKTL